VECPLTWFITTTTRTGIAKRDRPRRRSRRWSISLEPLEETPERLLQLTEVGIELILPTLLAGHGLRRRDAREVVDGRSVRTVVRAIRRLDEVIRGAIQLDLRLEPSPRSETPYHCLHESDGHVSRFSVVEGLAAVLAGEGIDDVPLGDPPEPSDAVAHQLRTAVERNDTARQPNQRTHG
jgi:hypothetical protein